ncbi:MAG: hypothetical protein QM820_38550 [Minicystis sp.]
MIELAAEARAETPIRVDYEAHAGCPGREVLIEEITWRTSLARAAAPGEDALEVRARITKRGALLRGHLTLGKGRETITREIEGPRCDEVVSALALVTALAIDPRASTAKKPAGAAAPAPSPPSPSPPPIVLPDRPLLPASLPEPAPPDLLARPLPVLTAPPAPLDPSRWSIGARALAAFAATPSPLFGGAIFVDRILSPHWGASLRVGAEVAATGAIDVGPGGAAFLRAAARVDGCALVIRPAPWLTLVPCVAAEAGVIRAEGLARGQITSPGAATVPWIALDFVPRITVDLGGAFLEAQGGPAFPLVRRQFLFESPAFVVHELPAVTGTVSVGAGFHFP